METNAEVGKYYKFTGKDSLLDYFGTEDMHLFKGNATLKCIDKNSDDNVKFERFNDWVDITDDLNCFEEVPNPCITSISLTGFEVGKWYKWKDTSYTPDYIVQGTTMAQVLDGRPVQCKAVDPFYSKCASFENENGATWSWTVYDFEEVPEPKQTEECKFEVGKWYRATKNLTIGKGAFSGWPRKCIKSDGLKVSFSCGGLLDEHTIKDLEKYKFIEDMDKSNQLPEDTALSKFEEGKWYRWVGPKDYNVYFSNKGYMDCIKDGEPHLCTAAPGGTYALFEDMTPFESRPDGAWHWGYHLEKGFIEECTNSDMCKKLTKFEVGKWYRTEHSTPIQVEKVHSSGWVKFVGSSETSSPSSLKNLYLCDPPVSNPKKEIVKAQFEFEVGKWYKLKPPVTKEQHPYIVQSSTMSLLLDGQPHQCKAVSPGVEDVASFESSEGVKWTWDLSKIEEVPDPTISLCRFEVGKWYAPLGDRPYKVKEVLNNSLITFESMVDRKGISHLSDWYEVERPWYDPILTLLNCKHWGGPNKEFTYYINKSGDLWRTDSKNKLKLYKEFWYSPTPGVCSNTPIRVGCNKYWDQVLFKYSYTKELYYCEWHGSEIFHNSCLVHEYHLESAPRHCIDECLCQAINSGKDPNTIIMPEECKFQVGEWYKPCKGKPVQVEEIFNNCVTFTNKSYCNINDYEFYKPLNKCEDTNLPKLSNRPWYEPILTLLNCRHWGGPNKEFTYYINKSGWLWRTDSLNKLEIDDNKGTFWVCSNGDRCSKTSIKVGCTDYWDQVLFKYDSKKDMYYLSWQGYEEFHAPCREYGYHLEAEPGHCRDRCLCEAINKCEDPNAIIMPEEKGTEVERLNPCAEVPISEPGICTLKPSDGWPTRIEAQFKPKRNTNKKLWLLFLTLNASKFTKEQFILLYFIWIKTL